MFGHEPLVIYVCVSECICVSADMSPYCSAHDEWLIMKLLQICRVQYCHQCVKFGGDPVKQFIVNVYQMIR